MCNEVLFINANGPYKAFKVKNGRFYEFYKENPLNIKDAIDLKNGFLMPGFIESHGHLLGLSQKSAMLDLRGLSFEEILQKVKEKVKLMPKNSLIKGRGWDQNLWVNKEFPINTELNKISQDHFIYLIRVDGHAVLVNKNLLDKNNINKHTKDPEGGLIIKDKNNSLTGVLIDNAIDLVKKI